MPVKSRRPKSRRLAPGRIKSLLNGPDSVLLAGSGYFTVGCNQIHTLDASQRQAAESAMREDWQVHRSHLLDIWRGRAVDPNASSRWFKIERALGPCWAERRFEAAGDD